MIRLLTPRPRRLVVIDTLGELSRRRVAQGVDVYGLTDIMLHNEAYQIAIQPQGEEEFEYVCNACAARRDITLAIDEMDTWFPTATHLPPQSLLNIALTGRHYGQELVCITHRPSAIHKSIMSQGTLWIFPMFDDVDIKKVQSLTRRWNCPDGINAQDIQPVEIDGKHVIVTEVARVSPTDAKVCTFNLLTGTLSAD